MSSACPFCGCAEIEPRQDHVNRQWSVGCTACGARGPLAPRTTVALLLWQQRTTEEDSR